MTGDVWDNVKCPCATTEWLRLELCQDWEMLIVGKKV